MPFSSGTFLRIHNWTDDRNNLIKITADRHDAEDDGFATGLTQCMLKDGTQTATAVIPFAAGLRASNGSVSAPSIAAISDTNTGVYFPSADAVGIAAGGALIANIAAAGLDLTGKLTVTVANASGMAVGRQGATAPALLVATNTASCVTGLEIVSKAAASGVAIAAISSGTNENLTFDAKGSGTITIGSVSTGAITLGRATTITTGNLTVSGGNLAVTGTGTIASAAASAFTVGANGATNPAFHIDASTGSSATGLRIRSNAAGSGVALDARSSGANENLRIDALGTGSLTLNNVATGPVILRGTATNDNASAGFVGEYIESIIASGSAVSLTTSTTANVTSISLTAGDWDVEGLVNIIGAATTNFTHRLGGISTTSATIDATAGRFNQWANAGGEVPNVNDNSSPIPRVRLSLASTTTVYLVARATFTVSTATAWGAINARRVR